MDILRVGSFCMYDDNNSHLFMGEEAGLLFFFLMYNFNLSFIFETNVFKQKIG